eukprot:204734-Chlamydomonas_euryale.AAC.1
MGQQPKRVGGCVQQCSAGGLLWRGKGGTSYPSSLSPIDGGLAISAVLYGPAPRRPAPRRPVPRRPAPRRPVPGRPVARRMVPRRPVARRMVPRRP